MFLWNHLLLCICCNFHWIYILNHAYISLYIQHFILIVPFLWWCVCFLQTLQMVLLIWKTYVMKISENYILHMFHKTLWPKCTGNKLLWRELRKIRYFTDSILLKPGSGVGLYKKSLCMKFVENFILYKNDIKSFPLKGAGKTLLKKTLKKKTFFSRFFKMAVQAEGGDQKRGILIKTLTYTTYPKSRITRYFAR